MSRRHRRTLVRRQGSQARSQIACSVVDCHLAGDASGTLISPDSLGSGDKLFGNDKLFDFDTSRLDWAVRPLSSDGDISPIIDVGDSSSTSSQRQRSSRESGCSRSGSQDGGCSRSPKSSSESHDKKIRRHSTRGGDGRTSHALSSSSKRSAGRSQVETRYRRNVSDHFEALKNCFGERELAQLVGGDNMVRESTADSNNPSPELSPRNKAMVLQGAVLFIKDGISRFETQQRRMQALQRKLRQARSALTDTSDGGGKGRFDEDTGMDFENSSRPPRMSREEQTIAWIA